MNTLLGDDTMKVKVNKKELMLIVDALTNFNGTTIKSATTRRRFYALYERLAGMLEEKENQEQDPNNFPGGYDEWPSDIEEMHAAWEAEAARVCQDCNPDLVWGTCQNCGRAYNY